MKRLRIDVIPRLRVRIVWCHQRASIIGRGSKHVRIIIIIITIIIIIITGDGELQSSAAGDAINSVFHVNARVSRSSALSPDRDHVGRAKL